MEKYANLKTKKGIYYDLKYSEYFIVANGIKYYFSSNYYMQKFKKLLQNHREFINTSLSNRFNVYITQNILSDIVLYNKIEKRGFYIVNLENGRAFKCRETLVLNGEELMNKN